MTADHERDLALQAAEQRRIRYDGHNRHPQRTTMRTLAARRRRRLVRANLRHLAWVA